MGIYTTYRIRVAAETLFLPIVDNGDTVNGVEIRCFHPNCRTECAPVSHETESHRIPHGLRINGEARPARNVLVFEEVTEECRVLRWQPLR